MTSSSLPPILQVGDVLLSSDIVCCPFSCDLQACRGACCVEGESGAPLQPDEVARLRAVLPHVEPLLTPAARRVIDSQGVSYTDADGDLVTSIVSGRDCVFAYHDNAGCCLCATEACCRRGLTTWDKPISCALYPIREHRLPSGQVALNYHRWSICAPAVRRGQRLGMPLYRFLEAPLVRRFGRAWYDELCATVRALRRAGYADVMP